MTDFPTRPLWPTAGRRRGLASRLLGQCLLIPLAWLSLAESAGAIPPSGYYDSADPSTGETLRATLHDLIDDHQRFPYTSSATDTWDILEEAQADPANSANIIDVYRNESYARQGGGNADYNREHTWPKSYGFPNDSSQNSAYTDCHMLYLSHDNYNSSRSNKPYGICDASCDEKITVANQGTGGGSGIYPGQSNWTRSGVWETWAGNRGNVARALLYADLRYAGGNHGLTLAAEPDLILTDDLSLIQTTGGNAAVGYMGLRSVLLQWHDEDPPDEAERERNDTVASYQGNRNPFIDHPEWVDCIFEDECVSSPVPLPTLSPPFLFATVTAMIAMGILMIRKSASSADQS